MHHNTDEYDESDFVIVQERGKASRRMAIPCEPLVISHQARGRGDREEIPEAELSPHADQDKSRGHDELHSGNHEQINFSK